MNNSGNAQAYIKSRITLFSLPESLKFSPLNFYSAHRRRHAEGIFLTHWSVFYQSVFWIINSKATVQIESSNVKTDVVIDWAYGVALG